MNKVILLIFTIIVLFSCTTTSNYKNSSTTNKNYSINDFCIHGFGFKYNQKEINSMNEFIRNHGKPKSIVTSDFINRQDAIKDTKTILIYPNYEVGFLNFSKREKWNPPESMLMYISSTKNGKYENGVSIGDMIDKTCSDLNVKIVNDTEFDYSNDFGNAVLLLFENTILSKIIWEYGRE
jgi:hypothetical protein